MNQFQLMRLAEETQERARKNTHNPAAMAALSNVANTYTYMAYVRQLLGEEEGSTLSELCELVLDAHGDKWKRNGDGKYQLFEDSELKGEMVSLDYVREKYGPIRAYEDGQWVTV